MKKTKFMLGAIVLSMGLLGTGYAYWTDTLILDTTVATGNFDMSISGGNLEYNYITFDNGNITVGDDVTHLEGNVEGIISSMLVIENDDELLISIPNMHPGTQVKIPFTIKNNGTIPAIGSVNYTLNQIEAGSTTTGEEYLDVTIEHVNKEGRILKSVTAADNTTTMTTKIQQLLNILLGNEHDNKPVAIEVGKELTYNLIIRATPGNEDSENIKRDKVIESSIEIDWTQWNNETAQPANEVGLSGEAPSEETDSPNEAGSLY